MWQWLLIVNLRSNYAPRNFRSTYRIANKSNISRLSKSFKSVFERLIIVIISLCIANGWTESIEGYRIKYDQQNVSSCDVVYYLIREVFYNLYCFREIPILMFTVSDQGEMVRWKCKFLASRVEPQKISSPLASYYF